MKELMKYFSCLLMVMLACIALPSCGGDDDDEPENSGDKSVKELLVGTWEYDEGDVYPTRMIFNADGTGKGCELYGSSDPDVWDFLWSYNEKTEVLTMVEDLEDDEDADIDFAKVITIDTNFMVLGFLDEDTNNVYERLTLKRVK